MVLGEDEPLRREHAGHNLLERRRPVIQKRFQLGSQLVAQVFKRAELFWSRIEPGERVREGEGQQIRLIPARASLSSNTTNVRCT